MNQTRDLCETPAGVSPNGVYNFIDPPSLGPAVLGVGISLTIVSTFFTVTRLYIHRKKMHIADWFSLVACVFNIAYLGVICSQHASFRHSWDIPVCWYTASFLKLPFVQTILFSPVFFFTKAAIFLLYLQLFATDKKLKFAIYFGLLIILLTYLSNIPLAAVYSAPDPGQPWTTVLIKLETDGHKFSLAGVVQSAVGTVMDLYIFFLPMPILMKLNMPLERRIQLVGIFSIALLGVAASVVSLYFKVQLLSSTDLSWVGAEASLCTLVETNVAIIVGCMPACAQFLAPLSSGTSTFFKSLRSRLLGSTQRGSRSGTAPGSGKGAVSGGSSSEYVGKASKNSYGRISDDSRRMHEYEMHDTWPLRTPPSSTQPGDGLGWHPPTKTYSEHSGADQMV